MDQTVRRYDIDWLRVIAIGLLIVYHIGIGFQPWGVFIKFIQNDKPLDSLWIPMSMLNIWRIPLLFFVSGMGVCFAMRKRNWKQLILERTRRIFIPFIFGIFFIVPVHVILWQKYYSQEITYSPGIIHLWFLGNIFIYVLLLSPLFLYLKNHEEGNFRKWMKKLYTTPAGVMAIALPFVLEAVIINPESFETYSLTLHGFLIGLLAFFFGFTAIYSGDEFWETALRWRWLYLALAIILFIGRLMLFDLKSPYYVLPVESISWILSAFGFAYRYLNRPGRTLRYLSRAAYPVYIIHMIFLYLGSYLIFPLSLPAGLKLILVIIFTIISCFVIYDLIIRRVKFIRLFFGLKSDSKN
jgi:glucan biosynthesis protein C